jgi:hypothetical protein
MGATAKILALAFNPNLLDRVDGSGIRSRRGEAANGWPRM